MGLPLVLPSLLQTPCTALLQELPEQVYLHPPLSIFVVEKRAFGRTVLVGTHVVSDVMKFSPRELEEEETEDVPRGELLGEVPVEAAGRLCPWQRSSAPLLCSQMAKSSSKNHKMLNKSIAQGRLALEAVVL